MALAACGGGGSGGGGGGGGGGNGLDVLTPDNFGKKVGQGSVKILDGKLVVLGTPKGDREFDLGKFERTRNSYYVNARKIDNTTEEKLVLGGRAGRYEYIDFGYWANIDTHVDGGKTVLDGTLDVFAYGNSSRYIAAPADLANATFRGTALGGVKIYGYTDGVKDPGKSNFKELAGSVTIQFNGSGGLANASINFPDMYRLATADGINFTAVDQTSSANADFSIASGWTSGPLPNSFYYVFFGPTANTATEMVGSFFYNAAHADSDREMSISGAFGAARRR